MKKLILYSAFLLLGYSSFAQSGFIHSATSSNIQNNWTRLDHANTNGNSNKLLFITQKSGASVTASPLGVWYTSNKWTIFNQNRSAFPVNAKFNVIAMDVSRNTFAHTASSSNISRQLIMLQRIIMQMQKLLLLKIMVLLVLTTTILLVFIILETNGKSLIRTKLICLMAQNLMYGLLMIVKL